LSQILLFLNFAPFKIINTRRSALQISANQVFKKKKIKFFFQKTILNILREIFFFKFFWQSTFRSQFGASLRNFLGSRPAGLGGDREHNVCKTVRLSFSTACDSSFKVCGA
jgi:hypothetical protein